MWALVFLLIGFSNVLTLNGRLLGKSTKPTVTEVILRRIRQVFDGDVDSQEYNSESIEQQNRQKETKVKTDLSLKPLKRMPRLSNGGAKSKKQNRTTTPPPPQKVPKTQTNLPSGKVPTTTKKPIVKKPISKVNEVETYDDFQSKVMLSPMRPDNMEHEDEDFNVDDYDFDAAHDEFSGRGKPLVPRQYKRLPKKEATADRTEKKTDVEAKTDEKKVKKSEDLNKNLGIINIPEPAPKGSKGDNKLKFKKIEKGYNSGNNKDLVGLASREGVYDFVFYRK